MNDHQKSNILCHIKAIKETNGFLQKDLKDISSRIDTLQEKLINLEMYVIHRVEEDEKQEGK